MRPLLVVKNGQTLATEQIIKHAEENKINWEELVAGRQFDIYEHKYTKPTKHEALEKTQGVLEYLDVDEFNGSLIANKES